MIALKSVSALVPTLGASDQWSIYYFVELHVSTTGPNNPKWVLSVYTVHIERNILKNANY